jgi:hypothetical protein
MLLAPSDSICHLIRAQGAAQPIVARSLFVGLLFGSNSVETFLGAKAVKSVALFQQHLNMVMIN